MIDQILSIWIKSAETIDFTGVTLLSPIITPAGEFISSKQGLGYLIIYGSQVFKLDLVIMSILILCVITTGLYVLISWVEKMYLKRI